MEAAIATGVAGIVVSIINGIFIIINTKTQNSANKRSKKNEELSLEIKSAIGNLDKKLSGKIDENTLNQDKRFLIQFMDKVEAGIKPSQEEIWVAFEVKKEYNDLGGDSYVDTRWDRLIQKGLI